MPLPAFVLPLMIGASVGGGMGAAGGKKGGGGGDATAAMSQEAFDMSKPAMQKTVDMFMNAANTGMGPESRQPIYSQAAEKSLQAGNQAQKKLGEELARTGLDGTPFAERAQREIEQTSQLNAARIPQQMEDSDWRMIMGMGPAATGGMNTGVQGMGVAEGIEAQQLIAMGQLLGQILNTSTGAFAGGENSAFAGMESLFAAPTP